MRLVYTLFCLLVLALFLPYFGGISMFIVSDTLLAADACLMFYGVLHLKRPL